MSKYIISVLLWLVGIFVIATINVVLILPIIAPEPGTARSTANIVLGLISGFIWYFVVRYLVFEKLADREARRSNYRY